jgi:hypothetical protein
MDQLITPQKKKIKFSRKLLAQENHFVSLLMKHFFFRCNLGRTLSCAGQYDAYITGDAY